MKVSKQRIDPTKLFLRRLLSLGLFFICIAGCFGVDHVYFKQKESRMLRTEAETRLAGLEQREHALQKDISTLSTDRGKEGILRTQYALSMPGEGVIQIVNGPAPVDAPSSTTTTQNWLKRAFSWW